MTVVMEDAVAQLSADDKKLHDSGALASILYADDTLLVGVSTDSLQRYLAAVGRAVRFEASLEQVPIIANPLRRRCSYRGGGCHREESNDVLPWDNDPRRWEYTRGAEQKIGSSLV